MKDYSLGKQISIVAILAMIFLIFAGFTDDPLKHETKAVVLANNVRSIDTLISEGIDTIVVGVLTIDGQVYPENATLYLGPVTDLNNSDSIKITIDKSANGTDWVLGTIANFSTSAGAEALIDLPLADEPKQWRLRIHQPIVGGGTAATDSLSYGLDIVKTYKSN